VGDYYTRIRRPEGNGYRAGNDITVEFYIQKALVTINAAARQEFAYDGNPKAVVFSVDQNIKPNVAYYRSSPDAPLNAPPIERGLYQALISYNGDAHHMGASKRVEIHEGGFSLPEEIPLIIRLITPSPEKRLRHSMEIATEPPRRVGI
jgi:hypothetical protein